MQSRVDNNLGIVLRKAHQGQETGSKDHNRKARNPFFEKLRVRVCHSQTGGQAFASGLSRAFIQKEFLMKYVPKCYYCGHTLVENNFCPKCGCSRISCLAYRKQKRVK